MKVYRLAKRKYADDLSGIGAEITGGRWNYKGTRVLYTADSRALCMAEIAAHTPVVLLPEDYYLITIEIPNNPQMAWIDAKKLPDNWKKFPYSKSSQEIGERFILQKEHLMLKVPSAVVQGDYNILINPLHADFEKVKIIGKEKIDFDTRLFQ